MLQNSDKPTCIDLILTNRPSYFQQSVFETGLSDFHMTVATDLKMGFQKRKPHIVAYRDYTHFDNEKSQTLKIVPQKKISNALRNLFIAYSTNVLLLKKGIPVPMRLPS